MPSSETTGAPSPFRVALSISGVMWCQLRMADFHPILIYLHLCPPLVRGREPVAPARGGRAGVRGRVRAGTRTRAVPGLHPGALRPPHREPADGVGETLCRKRGPAAVKAPDGAPKGATCVRKGRVKYQLRASPGAPSPSPFWRGPRAPRAIGEQSSGPSARENDGGSPQ